MLSIDLYFLFTLFLRKLVKGFEPPTYGLQNRCSTIELHQHRLVCYNLAIKLK